MLRIILKLQLDVYYKSHCTKKYKFYKTLWKVTKHFQTLNWVEFYNSHTHSKLNEDANCKKQDKPDIPAMWNSLIDIWFFTLFRSINEWGK